MFFYFKKINFLDRLAYSGNFWLFVASVFFQAFIHLFFLKIIFGWVGDLRGWNYYQALLVAGSVLLIDGVMWLSFAYLHDLKKQIRTGRLDGLLTKPMDSQFLMSIYRGDLEDAVRIVTGLAILVLSASQLSLETGALLVNLFWYLITLFNGLVMVYGLTLIFNTISFWTIEASMTFFLVQSFISSAKYPVDIFKQGWLRFSFTFGLPLAFMGTVPAQVFSDGFDGLWIGLSTLMAAVFFGLSRWFWKKGLAHYSSASS